MEKILNFIAEHDTLIILLTASLLDVILFLFSFVKKKKDPSLFVILAQIPSVIREAEKSFGSSRGTDKKVYVLEKVCKMYENLTGIYPGENSYVKSYLSSCIEDILKTPQRKEK